MYNLKQLKQIVGNQVPNSVFAEFDPIPSLKEQAEARNPANWKVHTKMKNLLILDCEPFDDQLRCYVTLDNLGNPIALEYQAE